MPSNAMRMAVWVLASLAGLGLHAGEGELVNTWLFVEGGKFWQLTLTADRQYAITSPGGQKVQGPYAATSTDLALTYPDAVKARRHFRYTVAADSLSLAATDKDAPSRDAQLMNDLPPKTGRADWQSRAGYERAYQEQQARETAERAAKAEAERQAKEEAARREAEARAAQAQGPVAPPVAQPAVRPVHPPVPADALRPPEDYPEPLLALWEEARGDQAYRQHREFADRAFLKGEWEAAHAHYEAALHHDPEDAEARTRASAAAGWLAVLRGDAARERRDWKTAKEEYHRAGVAYPPLRELYGARMSRMNRSRSGQGQGQGRPGVAPGEAQVAAQEARILDLIKRDQFDEAAKIADAATVLHPEHEGLLQLEDGLADLLATRERAVLVGAARGQALELHQQALAIDARDAYAAKLLPQLEALDQRLGASVRSARDLLLAKRFAELKGQPAAVRASARELGEWSAAARNHYDTQAREAREAGGFDFGVFRVGNKEASEKGKKLAALSAAYGELARSADELSRN